MLVSVVGTPKVDVDDSSVVDSDEDELDELEDELELEEAEDDVLLSEELTVEDSSESPKGQMA